MAISRQFKACNETLFRGVKQPFAESLVQLDLISLYHFLLTSTECYQIAIVEFRKRYHQLFLASVVTRNDIRTSAMLKHDASLFGVVAAVEDYSFRKFLIPAFTYYLFTWDQDGLELMLNAIAGCAQTKDAAVQIVSELSRQLDEWSKEGVTYQSSCGEFVKEKYYDPTKLCSEMTAYADNEELWSDNDCNNFINANIAPLQSLMPVHLMRALGVKFGNETGSDDGMKVGRFGDFSNPIYVLVEPALFGEQEQSQYDCYFPQPVKKVGYAVTKGVRGAIACKKPHGGAMFATCEVINDRYNEREQMVNQIRDKLIAYKKNPAALFTVAAESPVKKIKTLPRPNFNNG